MTGFKIRLWPARVWLHVRFSLSVHRDSRLARRLLPESVHWNLP